MDGKFCLSDDSHGVEQVALNYHQCIPYLERNDIHMIYILEASDEKVQQPFDLRFPFTKLQSMTVHDLRKLPFWQEVD